MEHFICGGNCGGVVDEAGSCTDSTCSNFGQVLTPCACEDKSSHMKKEEASEEVGVDTPTE